MTLTATEVLTGIDLTGRRMIVTGGTSGIGLETARALSAAGADVTVTARRPLHLAGLRVVTLDLTDLDAVRAFTTGWDGPLHALVANAGVMAIPERRLSPAGWELQLATNFLGHFALATGLHTHLRAAGDARVAIVSSGAQLRSGVDFEDINFQRRPYDPWTAYAQSKAAGVLLAVEIAKRWAPDGVVANAANPGRIHTNLQRHVDAATMRAMGAMDESGNLLHPAGFKTPQQGAAPATMLAAAPVPGNVTGRYFEEDRHEATVVPGGPDAESGVASWSMDPAAATRLWDLAERAIG
ncbi:SDR family NAD(P)-dependent oxidoreductase [Actinoplanes couchii]|uniref:Oxidoreductase n=1 Tax=Actinoplanes couchii TaxID=403638 RepID=A0ABQ3XR85_9ACTN|nr:SDR family NAD(P)-dependent oxidoreductase [Actinoplanes couchii]MDR6318219.1 NAD(P)-dependent dehydrogenase (short-subunit alcohol dehydrogenase family) [Actinoplanes couchii]GID61013.1 oxidoreductase [Actinoplanes couchii]